MNTGKLLVSTKSTAAGRKTVVMVSSAILIILGIATIFVSYGTPALEEMIDRTWGPILGLVLGVFMIGEAAFNLITLNQNSKSYCDVYENAVLGRTCLSYSSPNTPVQNFTLSYDEIANVTESGKNIIIYTKYTQLEVVALKNRAEAVRAIRARIGGQKQ